MIVSSGLFVYEAQKNGVSEDRLKEIVNYTLELVNSGNFTLPPFDSKKTNPLEFIYFYLKECEDSEEDSMFKYVGVTFVFAENKASFNTEDETSISMQDIIRRWIT